MKKLKMTSIIFGFWLAKTFAQPTCPSNGTHTDPAINPNTATSYATPASANFKQNTFDWTLQGWSRYYTDPLGNTVAGTISSPFWQPTLHYPFGGGQLGLADFKATDGWELIKQDMGYFYANTTWQGYPMGNIPTLEPNDPRGAGSTINYIILYNKYSGILRLMGMMPNYTEYPTVYIRMRFLNQNDYSSSAVYNPKPNALFNHYNPTNVSLGLDQKTYVTEISAAAMFPTAGEMFYADFQLAYDPCVCTFQSGFYVDFSAIKTASLVLHGDYAGATNINIASVGTGGNTIAGSNAGDNFIASVFEQGGSPKTAIQSYNNAIPIVNQDAAVQNSLNELSTGLGVASDLAEALGGVPGIGTVVGTAVKDGLDAASKFVSFYSSQVKPSDAISAAAAIRLESGYLSATGTITYDSTAFGGVNLSFGVPGSSGSTALPEYAPALAHGDVLPNYPMYNEPIGLFALLKTPKVNKFLYSPARPNNTNWGEINYCHNTGHGGDAFYYSQFYYGDQPPLPASLPSYLPSNLTVHIFPPSTPDYFKIEYNPAEDLVYALNPIVDVTKSSIYIAYEMDGMPNNTTKGQFTDHSLNGFTKDTLPSINSFVRNRTPLYPISCNTSIYTQEWMNYIQNYMPGNITSGTTSYCPFIGGNNGNCTYEVMDASNLFWPNSDLPLVNNPQNVRLVVMLALVTLPDVYGKVHATTQIIKYDCIINNVGTDLVTTGSGAVALAAISNLPTNLNIPQTTYSIPTNTFSFGTITITGNQTDNAPNNGMVNIAAEQAITLSSTSNNISLTGNMSLSLQNLPNSFTACSNTSIAPLSGPNLTAYCSTSGYNSGTSVLTYSANQAARTVASNNSRVTPPSIAAKTVSVETKLGTNINLGIFPNPTSGVVYLNLSAQHAGGLLVNISDLNGNQVMHSNFSANEGANSFKVDLGTLNSGAYFIHITDENGITIKNDKLILMGQ